MTDRVEPTSGAGEAPELTVCALTVRFGALTALEGVDLTVRAGDVVALAGENGAGKTTLIRAIAGDVTPVSGSIRLDGRPVTPDPRSAARLGIRIVWQDLALSDNLDVASNVMLGSERHRHMFSDVSLHNEAARVLDRLGIPLRDTTQSVRLLSGGQRQMVAVARAMARNPRLLLLDEPTASLGVRESALVELLITRLRAQGTTILLSCHDTEQMFRLADKIVVLRHGRVVTVVAPSEVRPDDVMALIAGQPVDSSARRQLTRLHGLAGRLVSSDPSSSLSLILSALGAALGAERLCIHLLDDSSPGGAELVCAASFGVPEAVLAAWARLPAGPAGGPVGLAAQREEAVIEDSIRAGTGSWTAFGDLSRLAKVASSWSVPVLGPGGLLGVITVFRSTPGRPRRDDLDLAGLYAGYAASAIERDRLLDQVTARNRLLETIRDVLQTLGGPIPVADGLRTALDVLRRGLAADEVALVTTEPDGIASCRAYTRGAPRGGGDIPPATLATAQAALRGDKPDAAVASGGDRHQAVTFAAPDGPAVLLASWRAGSSPDGATDLLADAAHSLRMALERERALVADQEAMALRQSRELHQAFLRRLSHELRTPLTAITGYATTLLQPDVTWDAESQQRFLSRIAAESARLGRLVNDLLDFSAIESGIFRLNSDWCDIPLVLDAAVAVLPPEAASGVEVRDAPGLPAIWADHDRLEQVFVNLLSNALSHNPPGTRVVVSTEAAGPATGSAATVTVRVADDGDGLPPELARAVTEASHGRTPRWDDVTASDGVRPWRRGAGAGLGLSIAGGIVAAHGGLMELEPVGRGTSFLITLPVEKPADKAPVRAGAGPARPVRAEPRRPLATTASGEAP